MDTVGMWRKKYKESIKQQMNNLTSRYTFNKSAI